MRMIVAFEKTARVRHLGHLDLMRFMQRALRRSGLPIRYSQGFNPHVLLSFASPLPVGVSGQEELMDVPLATEMAEEAFYDTMAAALPNSLPLVRVRAVDDKHPKLMAMLQTAAYDVRIADGEALKGLTGAMAPLLARDEIMAIRKTKSGEKLTDIRPMIHELRPLDTQDGLYIRVSLTELQTLKPELLLKTLAEQAGIAQPDCRLERLRLYGEADGRPVPLMEL